MLETIIFSAIEHSADHGNKSAFYISGAVLAAWAVLVGFLGVVRPAVTDGEVGSRVIMGGTAVLAVLTMVTAILTAS